MSNKNLKNEKPTNSVIEVVEKGEIRRLFYNGEELSVNDLDPDDSTSFAIKESDLGKIRGSDLQKPFVFIVDVECASEKFELGERVEFYYEDQPTLLIEIVYVNKLWEGFFGFRTWLEAIIEQVNHSANFKVIDSELDDNYKRVVISCKISADDLLIDSLNSAAEQYKNLVIQAEKALAKRAIELYPS